MTLVQSLVAPEKMEWIMEKAVETGISAILLVPAERSVTKLSGDRLAKRLSRLTDIARSAAEQCGRNVVPSISAAPTLKSGLAEAEGEIRLMLAPGAEPRIPKAIRPGLRSAAFAVGPEGGFTSAEIELAAASGWTPMLLGPRVLRTETAGLAGFKRLPETSRAEKQSAGRTLSPNLRNLSSAGSGRPHLRAHFRGARRSAAARRRSTPGAGEPSRPSERASSRRFPSLPSTP